MSDWISVNKEIPEFDVLVWVEFHLIKESGVDIGKYFKGSGWAFSDFSAQDYDPKKAEVTHWMPLPERPEDL